MVTLVCPFTVLVLLGVVVLDVEPSVELREGSLVVRPVCPVTVVLDAVASLTAVTVPGVVQAENSILMMIFCSDSVQF